MLDYILGWIHRVLFIWKYNRPAAGKLILSIICVPLVVAGILVRNDVGNGVALTAVVIAGFAWIERWRERQNYLLENLGKFPPQGFQAAVKRNGGQLVHQGSANELTALVDNNLNAALRQSCNPIKLEKDSYQLPTGVDKNIAVLLSLRGTKIDTTNENKVRLRSALTAATLANPEPIILQKTDYFSGLVTHELGKKNFFAPSGIAVMEGSQYFFNNNEIVPVDVSSASNHIGITTLAFTSDYRLVYQRERRGASGQAMFASSGSGSLDWEDIDKARLPGSELPTFANPLSFGMERELCEEVGATSEKAGRTTFVTGFARLIDRGGKPDFYGFTVLRQPSHDLRISKREKKYTAKIHFIDVNSLKTPVLIDVLGKNIKAFSKQGNVSMPFYLSLIFAKEFLEKQPENFVSALLTR